LDKENINKKNLGLMNIAGWQKYPASGYLLSSKSSLPLEISFMFTKNNLGEQIAVAVQ